MNIVGHPSDETKHQTYISWALSALGFPNLPLHPFISSLNKMWVNTHWANILAFPRRASWPCVCLQLYALWRDPEFKYVWIFAISIYDAHIIICTRVCVSTRPATNKHLSRSTHALHIKNFSQHCVVNTCDVMEPYAVRHHSRISVVCVCACTEKF